MQRSTGRRGAHCLEVVGLQFDIFPSAASQHFCCQVCLFLYEFGSKFGALSNFEAYDPLCGQ